MSFGSTMDWKIAAWAVFIALLAFEIRNMIKSHLKIKKPYESAEHSEPTLLESLRGLESFRGSLTKVTAFLILKFLWDFLAYYSIKIWRIVKMMASSTFGGIRSSMRVRMPLRPYSVRQIARLVSIINARGREKDIAKD